MSIRSIFSKSDELTSTASYTVLTSKNDGCTNNTYRKSTWASGLELLCQTSQEDGIKSVVPRSLMIFDHPDGKKATCWIALSDQANEGKKVFCYVNEQVIKLSSDTLDVPEQVMKNAGSTLFFFGRKLNSKYVLYRWDWKKLTQISGNYNGGGSW